MFDFHLDTFRLCDGWNTVPLLIPMITFLGPIIPNLTTGSIFIEAIFRVPFGVTSTIERDCSMIIGLTMLCLHSAGPHCMTHSLERLERSLV